MITAKDAKRLSDKFRQPKFTKLAQVEKYIIEQSNKGYTNCFIDGKISDLKKFTEHLNKNGFRTTIEGPPVFNHKFLSVEW